MTAFSRRGACPALSAPMQTGDGLLVRLNPLEPGLSPATLAGLCEAAQRHGNGVVEITVRGSLQIRGLTPGSAVLLARDVDGLGIRVRTGLPVEHGALAGLDPGETADPRPLAGRIREAADAAGLAPRLGPKVSVVVDGGGRSGLATISADVRLSAVRNEDRCFWTLAIAGDAATAIPLATLAEDTAAGAALAVLEAIAALGAGGRARDLEAEQLPRPAAELAGKSPPPPRGWGCIGSSGTAGPAAVRMLGPSIVPLRDGRSALAVALPFGHIDAQRLIALAARAEMLGASEIRLAPARTILALCPTEADARALCDKAGRLGFVVDAGDPRSGIAACPGAPACAYGRIAARDLATRIAAAHGGVLDGSVEIHVSGCAKGCAHPAEAALTLVGCEGGVGLVVGGTARDTPLAAMPAEQALESVGRVAGLVRTGRRPGETTAECAARLGGRRLAAAFEKG